MVSMMKNLIHMKPLILNHADTPNLIVLLMIKESGSHWPSVRTDHGTFGPDEIHWIGQLNPKKVLPCVQKVMKNVWLILWNTLGQFQLLSTLQIHLSNFTNLESITNQTVHHKILITVFSPLVSEKKMVTRLVATVIRHQNLPWSKSYRGL